MDDQVNLAEKLVTFSEHWRPKIVGRYNGDKIMVVKVQGEFVWHSHPETDDLFLVLAGRLTIRLRDAGGERAVELGPGELFVVPAGVEHCPSAAEEAHVLLIEPMGTLNTGDAGGPLTAEPQEI
jgi:mannose-6-phosphate isomerase-like protein (cupin superfamily)